MFRAVVLSVVLTLVAGPHVSLACNIWCHSEAGSTGCEHPGRTLGLAADDDCPDPTSSATANVPDDVRRVSATQADDGATPFHATPPTRVTRQLSRPVEPPRFDARTFFALRI